MVRTGEPDATAGGPLSSHASTTWTVALQTRCGIAHDGDACRQRASVVAVIVALPTAVAAKIDQAAPGWSPWAR
jgi:hypothetical protein